MKRGVLYIHWGDKTDTLNRSINSLKEVHPELPVEVKRLPPGSSLLDKASMARFSPFEETLFLDADTVVLDRLDFGFEQARKYGLACCICECPWVRRYGGLAPRGDMVEFNTGVIFWTKTALPVFDAWGTYAHRIDSSIRMVMPDGSLATMPCNDQAGFALAVSEMESPPYVLPMNWNFRPAWHRSWWGPIKVWHDYSDPPPGLASIQQGQLAPRAIVQYFQFGT